MKTRKQSLLNEEVVLLGLTTMILLNGCSPCNRQAFIQCSPKTMGVVIGHEIKATKMAPMGQTIAFGVLSGAIGGAIAQAIQPVEKLNCSQQIQSIAQEELIRQLEGKGFTVRLLRAEPIKWDLFENADDKSQKALNNLTKKYRIESEKDSYDAIVVVEYILQTIVPSETSDLSSISVESLNPDLGMSRIWIYDTRTKKNLYYEFISHGYGFSKDDVPKAARSMVILKDIPEMDKH